MKRSEINLAIDRAAEFFTRMSFQLPPYAEWTPEMWRSAGEETREIRECMLGWDVTDFGTGNFPEIGRTLFTLRNGRHNDPRYPKPYAEKIIYNPESQRAPLHFHRSKMEDIVNRGGGNVLMRLWEAGPDDRPLDEPLVAVINGISRTIAPGTTVRLAPGESICLPPRTIHSFWGEVGTGASMCGEVSSVCDDRTDNFFLEKMERFPAAEEDEQPRRLRCNDYPAAAL